MNNLDPQRARTNLQSWLVDYIAQAFRGVQLGCGMTIYTGESYDLYGDVNEDGLSLGAERIDWQRVPIIDIVERHCALSYLDSEGFRFYAPAIMTLIVRGADGNGLLTDNFLSCLHEIRSSCRFRDAAYCELFNRSQRAAIIRFVKYQIHNVPGGRLDEAMQKTLVGLPRCGWGGRELPRV